MRPYAKDILHKLFMKKRITTLCIYFQKLCELIGAENSNQKKEKQMDEWIKTEDEYPPCDGWYWGTCFPGARRTPPRYQYDGYGFKFEGNYVTDPDYWKSSPPVEKQYGKRNK